jgi:hypothetical protein
MKYASFEITSRRVFVIKLFRREPIQKHFLCYENSRLHKNSLGVSANKTLIRRSSYKNVLKKPELNLSSLHPPIHHHVKLLN